MSSQDEVLEYLVKKVEETGAGSSITLCMNGSIIVGDIMSSKMYYEEMSKFFDGVDLTTNNRLDIETGRKYLEHYKQFMRERARSSEEQNNPRYIHLNKVVIYPSDPSHPSGASVWRGKLSSVDGFSLGRGYLRPKDD
jgi:hypothetical protein